MNNSTCLISPAEGERFRREPELYWQHLLPEPYHQVQTHTAKHSLYVPEIQKSHNIQHIYSLEFCVIFAFYGMLVVQNAEMRK